MFNPNHWNTASAANAGPSLINIVEAGFPSRAPMWRDLAQQPENLRHEEPFE